MKLWFPKSVLDTIKISLVSGIISFSKVICEIYMEIVELVGMVIRGSLFKLGCGDSERIFGEFWSKNNNYPISPQNIQMMMSEALMVKIHCFLTEINIFLFC